MNFIRNNMFYFSAASALNIKMISVLLAYLLTTTVSRRFGADDAGYFFYGMTLVTLLSAVSGIGLDSTLVRFISAEKACEAEGDVMVNWNGSSGCDF